jgi:hypothetical protein
MDARLIPSVYDTAKKVIQLEKLKAEFKRCNDLLQCEYEDDDPKTIWRKKKIIRYVDRIAKNITHIQTELYGQPKMSKEN